MIEIKGLSKAFPGRKGQEPVQALFDVNLAVRDNEFLTVLGPSGCGKTTLLRCIAGLVPYDTGEVLIDGTKVTSPGPDRAVVFQNFALMPWDNVLTNVAFGLEMQGVDRKTREAKAKELPVKNPKTPGNGTKPGGGSPRAQAKGTGATGRRPPPRPPKRKKGR